MATTEIPDLREIDEAIGNARATLRFPLTVEERKVVECYIDELLDQRHEVTRCQRFGLASIAAR